METLIFQKHPVVTFGGNIFANVPIILQFEETPLIALAQEENLGITTEVPIYHSDGTYLAKVRGTRLFPTEDGKKAGIEVRSLPQLTVCKMGDNTLFEIHHQQGDAFRVQAELHAPEGFFVKYREAPQIYDATNTELQVRGLMLRDSLISNVRIGVLVRKDGFVGVGVH